MAQHLHAVTLVVPDYDEAIDFYVGKLGFRLVADHVQSEDKRWVLVAPPGDNVGHVLLAKAVGTDQRAAIGHQTGGRVGFFLHTNCFEKDYARMKAAGVYFEENPRSEPYGQVVVWQDPFGNRWDLLQLG